MKIGLFVDRFDVSDEFITEDFLSVVNNGIQ